MQILLRMFGLYYVCTYIYVFFPRRAKEKQTMGYQGEIRASELGKEIVELGSALTSPKPIHVMTTQNMPGHPKYTALERSQEAAIPAPCAASLGVSYADNADYILFSARPVDEMAAVSPHGLENNGQEASRGSHPIP